MVGKILANCQPFTKFAKIFPLQNFPTYGTLYMHTIVVGVNFDGHAGVVVASRLRYMWCRDANIDIVWTPVVKKGNLVFGPVFRHLLTVLQIGIPYFNNLPQGDLEIPCKLNKFFGETRNLCDSQETSFSKTCTTINHNL